MYFFDTYALFEILQDNPAYVALDLERVNICILNYGELYYGLIRKIGRAKAETVIKSFKFAQLEVTEGIMRTAMRFRFAHRHLNVSPTDCVGYVLAKAHGLRFLTGDEAFRGLQGVEFVK